MIGLTLTEGKKAPAFTSINQDGEKISLKDFLGKKVVLFFYPKDMTATCTVEACNLRDNFSILKKYNIEVIGISPDGVKSHKKFETKYQLPYNLVVDSEAKIAKKYGVWGPKKFMGREYIGLHRTTFLIDEKGKIAHIIQKVKSKEHSQQILTTWGL